MKKLLLIYSCFALLSLSLSACMPSEAEKPLVEMAEALKNRDAHGFLSQIDMPSYAQALMNNSTKANPALKRFEEMGKLFGIGGLGNIFGSVAQTQKEETRRFQYGVSSGELIIACQHSARPGCPWVPDSLRNAKVKEITKDMAVAPVTTPSGITSWLALAKIQGVWKVVGQARLEADAAYHAQSALQKHIATPQEKAPDEQKVLPSPDEAPAPPPPLKNPEDDVVHL